MASSGVTRAKSDYVTKKIRTHDLRESSIVLQEDCEPYKKREWLQTQDHYGKKDNCYNKKH